MRYNCAPLAVDRQSCTPICRSTRSRSLRTLPSHHSCEDSSLPRALICRAHVPSRLHASRVHTSTRVCAPRVACGDTILPIYPRDDIDSLSSSSVLWYCSYSVTMYIQIVTTRSSSIYVVSTRLLILSAPAVSYVHHYPRPRSPRLVFSTSFKCRSSMSHNTCTP